MRSLLLVALTIFVTLGYIAVPVLFQFLPKPEAGEIAGVYLNTAHWIMLFAVILVWMLAVKRFQGAEKVRWRLHLPCLFLLLMECGQLFIISPEMKALKAQAFLQTGQHLNQASSQWAHFAMLHGISQLLYLTSCLLALYCFFALNRLQRATVL